MLKVTFYGDVYAGQDPRTAMHAHVDVKSIGNEKCRCGPEGEQETKPAVYLHSWLSYQSS